MTTSMVRAAGGVVRGFTHAGSAAFLGIRYTTAPVGAVVISRGMLLDVPRRESELLVPERQLAEAPSTTARRRRIEDSTT
jgi:hypothetical protein